MPPRKRKRSRAFAPDEIVQNAPPEEVLDLHSDREGEEEEEQQDQDDLKDGVWDNFREQHHEGVFSTPSQP